MNFITTEKWNEPLWEKVKGIYLDAFYSGKPEDIIRNMFSKEISFLHILMEEQDAVAMAITGTVKGDSMLLIDYLAVRKDMHGKGVGLFFFEHIKKWALLKKYNGILLEAESEPTAENLSRIRFWKKCNFELLDDYTHQYVWVPEPYKAMWHSLKPNEASMKDGREAFRHITAFHKESFRK